ncbi:MAG: hypothetical protein AAF493_01965 [Pseudomonadota bacterium]
MHILRPIPIPALGRVPEERTVSDWARVALAVLLLVVCRSQVAHATVQMDVAVGFGEVTPLRHWTPITVTLDNQDRDVHGHVDVTIRDDEAEAGETFETTYRQSIELSRGGKKRLRFTVYTANLAQPILVRLVAGGTVISEREISLRTKFTERRLVVVLSADADLDYLNSKQPHQLQVSYPLPIHLPNHWKGYDGVVAVIAHNFSFDRLSTPQFDALSKWVANGGIISLSGGLNTGLMRTERLANWLPVRVVGTTSINANALGVALNGEALGANPNAGIHRVSNVTGRVLRESKGRALAVDRPVGHGRVLYLAFDITKPPLVTWASLASLWHDLLQLPKPIALTFESDRRRYADSTLFPTLMRERAKNYPSHTTLFVFVSLYLLVLAIGYRLQSTMAADRRWLPRLTWAVPLLFAPLAYVLFAQILFPPTRSRLDIATVEPLPNTAYAHWSAQIRLYSTTPDPLRIHSTSARPVFRPAPESKRTTGMDAWRASSEGAEQSHWILHQGARPGIQPRNAKRYAHYRLTGEDIVEFELDGSLNTTTGQTKRALTLRNQSGRAIADLWAFSASHAFALGNLANGDTASYSLNEEAGVARHQQLWRDAIRDPGRQREHRLLAVQALLQGQLGSARLSAPLRHNEVLVTGFLAPQTQSTQTDWERVNLQMVSMRLRPRLDGMLR